MIQVQQQPGQLILDHVAVRLRPLLTREEFLEHCQERNLNIPAELLQHLEEQRAFTSITRCRPSMSLRQCPFTQCSRRGPWMRARGDERHLPTA